LLALYHSFATTPFGPRSSPTQGSMTISTEPRAGPDHLFQFSLRSRCTAMLAGLRTLIQNAHRPDRLVPSTRFDTMPSAPSRQACSNTVGPSSATCSLTRIFPPRHPAEALPARPCGRGTDAREDPRHRARSHRRHIISRYAQPHGGAARR
jgi:hypothetical protein